MTATEPGPLAPPADPASSAPFLLYFWRCDRVLGDDRQELVRWFRVGPNAIENTILAHIGVALVVWLAFLSGFGAGYVFLVVAPVALLSAYFKVRRIRAKQRLIAEGRLLEGEVVRCQGKWVSGRYEDSYDSYRVSVYYRFRTPEGLVLPSAAAADREDLENTALPSPGTPLRILYLNEKNYQLL